MIHHDTVRKYNMIYKDTTWHKTHLESTGDRSTYRLHTNNHETPQNYLSQKRDRTKRQVKLEQVGFCISCCRLFISHHDYNKSELVYFPSFSFLSVVAPLRSSDSHPENRTSTESICLLSVCRVRQQMAFSWATCHLLSPPLSSSLLLLVYLAWPLSLSLSHGAPSGSVEWFCWVVLLGGSVGWF